MHTTRSTPAVSALLAALRRERIALLSQTPAERATQRWQRLYRGIEAAYTVQAAAERAARREAL